MNAEDHAREAEHRDEWVSYCPHVFDDGSECDCAPVLRDAVEEVERLREALKAVEFGFGDGCPDCGASGIDDDWHRACCLVGKALYTETGA